MKTQFLSLVGLATFMISCGSPDSPVTPRQSQSITTTSHTTGNADVTLNSVIYAGNDVSFKLAFTNGYDVQCVDGQTYANWKAIGDSSKFSLSDVNSCHPTLTTSPNFDGVGTVQGEVSLPGIGLVRYTGTLAFKKPIQFNMVPIGVNDWASKADGVTANVAANWFTTATFSTSDVQNIMRIRTENTPTSTTVPFEQPFFVDGNQTNNRTFKVDISNAVTDPDGEANVLSYSLDCGPAPGKTFGFLKSCPLQFDAVDPVQKIIKISFKPAVNPKAYNNLFFMNYSDVFNAIPTGTFVSAIKLSIQSPHLANPLVVTLGTINLVYSVR